MIEVLKDSTPVAKKEHRCMYCGCIIPKGERYRRETLKFDGELYEWTSHTDCDRCVDLLRMSDNGDGVDENVFAECLSDYLYEFYTDEKTDDLPEGIRKMSRIEQVRTVLADWDKPFIETRRLGNEIRETELDLHRSYPKDYLERKRIYLEKLKEKLKKLEEKIHD